MSYLLCIYLLFINYALEMGEQIGQILISLLYNACYTN